MNNKWVRTALVKNLLKTVTQHLAVQLRQAQIIDPVYKLVMTYLHDHSTGFSRGQIAAELYLTEDTSKEEDNRLGAEVDNQKAQQTQDKEQWTGKGDQGDFNAMPKGGKKGTCKGYGARWHCGEWGHPHRECPQLIANQQGGTLSALKGKRNGFKG